MKTKAPTPKNGEQVTSKLSLSIDTQFTKMIWVTISKK
jgi:uncharacterized phage infection (PIP) family protein YhgE